MCFLIRPERDVVAERVAIPSVFLQEREVTALYQIHGLQTSQCGPLVKRYKFKKLPKERKSSKGNEVRLLSNGPQMWLFESDSLTVKDSLASLRKLLEPTGATVTDLTSARAIIRVSGISAHSFLKKGTPINVDGMKNRDVVVTLLGHLGATIHYRKDYFDVYVLQSYREDFWQWCRISAREFNQ